MLCVVKLEILQNVHDKYSNIVRFGVCLQLNILYISYCQYFGHKIKRDHFNVVNLNTATSKKILISIIFQNTLIKNSKNNIKNQL